MKIGFASRWDPLDKKAWSGTIHYMYRELMKRHQVEVFHFEWTRWLRELLTTQKSINRRWFAKQTSVEFLKAYARYFSHRLTKALRERPVDILFIPASSQLLAYLETEIPIVYMTDASFFQLQGYYSSFSNLARYNVRQGIDLDRRAFQRADHCLLASQWCADSALRDYKVDPSHITVAPCGANLDQTPASSSLDTGRKVNGRLVFIGVEWERKGGPILMDAFNTMKAMGRKIHLTLVGCKPPQEYRNLPGIEVYEFLDKNNAADRLTLDRILRESDLLVLPTRAECAGIVFSEAAAYGVPVITSDTGGVASYVDNGVNGYRLPVEDGGPAYAAIIAELLEDHQKMAGLRAKSRERYDQLLNWSSWADALDRVFGQIRPRKNVS